MKIRIKKRKVRTFYGADYTEVYNYPIYSLLKVFTLLPNKPDI